MITIVKAPVIGKFSFRRLKLSPILFNLYFWSFRKIISLIGYRMSYQILKTTRIFNSDKIITSNLGLCIDFFIRQINKGSLYLNLLQFRFTRPPFVIYDQKSLQYRQLCRILRLIHIHSVSHRFLRLNWFTKTYIYYTSDLSLVWYSRLIEYWIWFTAIFV